MRGGAHLPSAVAICTVAPVEGMDDQLATLQRVVELGYNRSERTPWAKTVRTCQQMQQRSGKSPEPVGDSAQDQPWCSIPPRADPPQPTAYSYHQPAPTGPGCLGVPRACLDCPPLRRSDAITVTGSLSSVSTAAELLCPLSDDQSGVHWRDGAPDPERVQKLSKIAAQRIAYREIKVAEQSQIK